MNTSNEARNYFKLQLLMKRSNELLRSLFKNRYSLLNNGTLWTDSPEFSSNYLQMITQKHKKINLTPGERTTISNESIDQWDTPTIITLLLSMDRPTTLTSNQIQEIDQENAQLEKLKLIRNRLAHHSTKSINIAEFDEQWSELKAILIAFRDIDTEIDQLKDDSVLKLPDKIINEENLQKLIQLNLSGTQAHKDGRYSDAITFFTQAKDLADVPDDNLAGVYSNMAGSRLALYEHDRASYKDLEGVDPEAEPVRALEDAKTARRLLPSWWKGHFRVGKAYAALDNHKDAINSFEQAFSLNPEEFEIRKALDESRLVLHRKAQANPEYLDPKLYSPMSYLTLEESIKQSGLSPEMYQMNQDLLEKLDPSKVDVRKGHAYASGNRGVEQNYAKAAEHFRIAAEKGNAEGMYNLAILTTYGLGVQKDHYAALELLRQAAEQPPYHPVHKKLSNNGVADAEHMLGVRYFEGITVEKDPTLAFYWYQRATEHGSALAANNLACLYLNGIGVDKDLDKAEHYLELSSKRGNPLAMLTLAEHLLWKDDFQMAQIWYDRACEKGNVVARQNRKQFLEQIQKRQNRKNAFGNSSMYAGEKLINTVQEKYTAMNIVKYSYLSNYKILYEHAEMGSKTAKIMCNALEHFVEALEILDDNENLTEEQENMFIHELSQTFRIEHIVAQFSAPVSMRADQVINRVLNRCSQLSNCAISQLDEDVRFCYAVKQMNSYKQNATFLKSCREKYPKSVDFLLLSGAIYGFLGQPDKGLYNINVALEIEPNNCELLYHKAVLLRHLDKYMNEAIEVYQKFLEVAPKDHRKVPDVYYEMALCYWRPNERRTDFRVIGPMKKLYEQGKQAEKSQLPCFLPYDSGNLKHLEYVFNLIALHDIDTDLGNADTRKSHLADSHRIEVIINHRKWEGDDIKMKSHSYYRSVSASYEPRVRQKNAKSLVGLKPITLREMNSTIDKVYNGHVLTVTIIENALTWSPSIHLIIEDEDFYCERMLIYNIPEKECAYYINKVYTVGSKMHIINPYLRIGTYDKKPSIRIDDVNSIIMENESERIPNMCRYCGEANAPHVCAQCEQARYCSKECQTNDWKLYKHKLICYKKPSS